MADSANGNLLQFEVDAALLIQLGEQLVARRSIALGELIKNAYDADATSVKITMENIQTNKGSILIEDNGAGMTLSDIKRGWMRIATTVKRDNPLSPVYRRLRTGAKGIGRFAARRLADTLILSTIAVYSDGTKRLLQIPFEWKNQFRPGTVLSEPTVTYTLKEMPNDSPTGTILLLDNIGEQKWTKEDIEDLRRDLSSLISPYPITDLFPGKQTQDIDPGFAVTLKIPEFPTLEGQLGAEYLDAAWGTLTGNIDEDNKAHYFLKVKNTKETVSFTAQEDIFPGLSGVKMLIRFIQFKKQFFSSYTYTLRDAQKFGREHGGVRLYIDGFRVFPYGDPGDDWLELDQIRAGRVAPPESTILSSMIEIGERPFLSYPGNNQLFGIVVVSRLKNPDIVVNVSREQVLRSPTFENLRRFIRLGIAWMTLQYAKSRTVKPVIQFDDDQKRPLELLNRLSSIVATAKMDPDMQGKALELLCETNEAVRKVNETNISKIALLRVLSATGAAFSLFNHQLGGIRTQLLGLHQRIIELEPFISGQGLDTYKDLIVYVGSIIESFNSQVSQLQSLLGQRGRGRRVRVPLHELVTKVEAPLSYYRRLHGIAFDNQVPEEVRTPPIFEAEIYAVLLHLITNALKAVREKQDARIAVRAEHIGNELRILVLDNGKGLDPKDRERVFQPFESDSTPDIILGPGTGLGLTVVRETVQEYGGVVRFVDAPVTWVTCVEILLPD